MVLPHILFHDLKRIGGDGLHSVTGLILTGAGVHLKGNGLSSPHHLRPISLSCHILRVPICRRSRWSGQQKPSEPPPDGREPRGASPRRSLQPNLAVSIICGSKYGNGDEVRVYRSIPRMASRIIPGALLARARRKRAQLKDICLHWELLCTHFQGSFDR